MAKKSFHDNFDYENARMDIFDAGGDPDYLSSTDPEERDRFLRKMGMDPKVYGSKWDKNKGKKTGSDDGCFLTSACVLARGLPDDCEELTVLREFRDTWLRAREGGEEEIRTYYALAPAVVERVNAREDSGEIWNRIYEEMVLPCVRLIKTGRPEEAFRLYKSCTRELACLSEM